VLCTPWVPHLTALDFPPHARSSDYCRIPEKPQELARRRVTDHCRAEIQRYIH